MAGSQKGSGAVRGPWTELARWRARRKSVGRIIRITSYMQANNPINPIARCARTGHLGGR